MMDWLYSWAAVLGPSLDAVGAIFVFNGIRISFKRAKELEKVAMPVTLDALGGATEALNQTFSENRATERVKASRWATAGLVFFVFGFGLQAFAGWPGK